MAVDITLGATATSGIPHPMFVGANVAAARDATRHQWAGTPDGRKFIVRLANNSGTSGANRGTAPQTPGTFNAAAAAAGSVSTASGLSHSLTVNRGMAGDADQSRQVTWR
jgi:hypothetical protein